MWKVTSVFFLPSAFLRMTNAADIHVKLAPGATLIDIQDLGTVTPLFTLPIERLKELCEVESGLPDLTLWYRVVTNDVATNDNEDEADLITIQENIMETYYGVITDVVTPKVAPPPNDTPDFTANQNYLLPHSQTNNGIDAEYSWTFSGGNGEGIKIYDLEWKWNLQHEDLTVMHTENELLGPYDEAVNRFDDDYHGTAVLGEMVGTLNGIGITGICNGAKAKVVPVETVLQGFNVANAIMLAVDDGSAGDVIIIEVQVNACGINYGPAEEYFDVFQATQIAVAQGFVVVAAAGNGDVNLDDPLCAGKYDKTKRDSGAIMVGAGGSGRNCWNPVIPARFKMPFSTYGSRVDVHAWGECVWTTGDDNIAKGAGYYDLSDPLNKNKWYTGAFAGTSSASPFVAAAAANIQGIAMKAFGAPLKPKDVRKLLSDTGLEQLGDTSKRIGPLVSLRGAIEKLLFDVTSHPTQSPTLSPSKKNTSLPTSNPTTLAPTTSSPTSNPTTTTPSNAPTFNPTKSPTTSVPTSNPTTLSPTTSVPTSNPTTLAPTTSSPTSNPTTPTPSNAPTFNPTKSQTSTSTPTSSPTTAATSNADTSNPTMNPTTSSPTFNPTTVTTTSFPTFNPTTVSHGDGSSKSSKQATKSSKSKPFTRKSKASK